MIEYTVNIPAQNVSAMWEAEAAAEWERQNAPDKYHEQMVKAACSMDIAVDHLDKALDFLLDALNAVDNTPMENRVKELLEMVEDIKTEVDMQKDKYEGGERE